MTGDQLVTTLEHVNIQAVQLSSDSENLADRERNREDKAFLERKAQYWRGYADAVTEILKWIRS